MRDRDMERITRQNPDLDERVAQWRASHPSGTLRDAVTDLELWHNPGDADAQRMIWLVLRRLGDAAAVRQGFPAMRAAGVPTVRDAAPESRAAAGGAATDCAAGTPQAGGTS
jgi:hypothetical protein